MAKPIQRRSNERGFYGRENALVFCNVNQVSEQIYQLLEKRNVKVKVISQEASLSGQLIQTDPDLIFIDVNALAVKSIMKMIEQIFAWMRYRAREINDQMNTPNRYLWQKAKVILFESDLEISPTGSLVGEIIDRDNLIKQCDAFGEVHYIGMFTAVSFISKIRVIFDKE